MGDVDRARPSGRGGAEQGSCLCTCCLSSAVLVADGESWVHVADGESCLVVVAVWSGLGNCCRERKAPDMQVTKNGAKGFGLRVVAGVGAFSVLGTGRSMHSVVKEEIRR